MCPLENKCNVENMVYQANISTREGKINNKTYIGISLLEVSIL